MEWDLAERSRKCMTCKKEFKTGDQYYTALFMEDAQLKLVFPGEDFSKIEENAKTENPFTQTAFRVELCPECWSIKIKEHPYDCEWKGMIMQAREEKRNLPRFNKHQIHDFFRELYQKNLEGCDSDARVEHNGILYFLAIMLERKNILLHQKNEVDPETQIRSTYYQDNKTKENYVIPEPLLSAEMIQKFKEKISSLLESNAS